MSPAYKVVLLGEGRVGKTSLVSRFMHDTFDENQNSTIQASMYTSADVPLQDASGGTVCINIWDTAGQERFHALGPIYYRNANGALLVYDITDANTLEKVRLWIRELRAIVGDQIQLVICGNKSDLERDRDVTQETAAAFAKTHGALHFETSAKTNINVAEAFQALATMIAKVTATKVGDRDVSSFATDGEAIAPTGRHRRRAHLRIEDDVKDGGSEKGKQQQQQQQQGALGGGTLSSPASTSVNGATVATGLSKEDYLYRDGKKARPTGPTTVDLSAPPTIKPSNSSGRSSCCF